MIDTHTHSKFSHDGCQRIETMVKKAKEMGLEYFSITDHCDWDYLAISGYEYFHQLDLSGYLKKIERVKNKTQGIDFAIGLELGYHSKAASRYKEFIPFERFDYIINSVHSIGNHDVYFPAFFEGRERLETYKQYLLGVLESINAPYPYNTIGHIGYISKNSTYDNKTLFHSDFADIIDEVLKAIIAKDKTLEINSNIKTDLCMPNISILKRYVELGGQNVVFGSDAHKLKRLAEGYNRIRGLALELGFKYWTVYKEMQPKKIKIT